MKIGDVEEGSTQWMAWIADQVCPICGRGISDVLKTSCRCAAAVPCGHKVLKGADAVDRIRRLWASAGPAR